MEENIFFVKLRNSIFRLFHLNAGMGGGHSWKRFCTVQTKPIVSKNFWRGQGFTLEEVRYANKYIYISR